jgi:hypothetical protein
MGTNNNTTVVVSFSIAILLLLSLLLLLTYNSKCSNGNSVERMQNAEDFYNNVENFKSQSVADIANQNVDFNRISGTMGSAIQPSESSGNETFNPVNLTPQPEMNSIQGGGMGYSQDASYASSTLDNVNSLHTPDVQSCFPRDRLTADDLLPKDAADSKWARLNPSGTGDIRDQNYLTAGYHVGVNTVGQSLRNANLQLRSEIPNPQNPVGPWMISTIEPDLRQNTLEIGSSPSY